MPATVTLSDLTWSAPDGSRVLHDLSLSFGPGRTGIVGRNGSGKTTLLRLIADELAPQSGGIRCSGRVALMRQEVQPRPGDTLADLMGVRPALAVLDRAEAGLADAAMLAGADWTLRERIAGALQRMGVDLPLTQPLTQLSGGQRSRVALAALILAAPDILLMDEPTNNLDQSGRDLVLDVLRQWRGTVIVVSHDRALLDEMDAIVELTSLGASRYGGNYTAYRAAKAAELAHAAEALAQAERSSQQVARQAQQAKERKARKDAAGHKSRARGGAPKILLDAARERAEASGGAGLRLRAARSAAAAAELQAARARIEVLQPLQMDQGSSGLAPGRPVLRVEAVSLGPAGAPPLIRDLSFTITGPERVVIAGPNGCGKSTLLRFIAGRLRDGPGDGLRDGQGDGQWLGQIRHQGSVTVGVPFAMLDQQLDLLDPGADLLQNLRRLHPAMERQAAQAVLARFGFRADAAQRRIGTLSGGERLRAGLAATLGADPRPMLLILDEPTNHLDLDGVTALEAALRDYDGAVLAVSHDPAFLTALAPDRILQLQEFGGKVCE